MNVGQKASEALVHYLSTRSPALTTVTNFYAEAEDYEEADGTDRVRETPFVLATFSDAQEYPMGTGNYSGVLNIKVGISADDKTKTQLNAIYDEVWSHISTDTFLADLNAAAVAGDIDFTAFGYTESRSQTSAMIEGRHRTKTIGIPINCCARITS